MVQYQLPMSLLYVSNRMGEERINRDIEGVESTLAGIWGKTFTKFGVQIICTGEVSTDKIRQGKIAGKLNCLC